MKHNKELVLLGVEDIQQLVAAGLLPCVGISRDVRNGGRRMRSVTCVVRTLPERDAQSRVAFWCSEDSIGFPIGFHLECSGRRISWNPALRGGTPRLKVSSLLSFLL